MTPARQWIAVAGVAVFLAAAAVYTGSSRAAPPLPAAAEASSCFKITFGLDRRFPNVVWSGGFRNLAQIRSLTGWHLDSSDAIHAGQGIWDVTLRPAGRDIEPKAVIVDLTSPEQQPVTFFTRRGDDQFTPAEISYGKPYLLYGGDVSIERVPPSQKVTTQRWENDAPSLLKTRDGTYWLAWVGYRTRSRDGYFYNGADEVLVSRSPDGLSWSGPVPLTLPGDHFRVALGQDAQGRIWCVYGLQKQLETGNFDLYAKSFDGRNWSGEEQLTKSPMPDIFHRMATDAQGNLYLVWMGFRPGPQGAKPQSDILMRVRTSQGWGPELQVTESAEDDWEPAVAVGRDGRAWIAWDSYRLRGEGVASYDLMLRDYRNGQFGAARVLSGTAMAEMHADVAVDGADRVWVAWEEGGANWGKDTGYDNPKHRIHLRPGGSRLYGPVNSKTALYRRPRVAVLEGGSVMQPKARFEECYPQWLQANLYQNPRLGVDASGRIWVFLRHQLIATGRNTGQIYDFYATTLTGEADAQRWMTPVLLPGSTGRMDTVLSSTPAQEAAIAIAMAGDGRLLPVGLPGHRDITSIVLADPGLGAAKPVLTAFRESSDASAPVTHPGEAGQVAAIEKYRISLGGKTYRIIRGDLHRHTQISMDGGVDGSLWDLYRYAMDAAAMDYIGVTDHNYGAWLDTDEPESRDTDDEYEWWRTQKSADLFHVPGRFVPLYGYERSINFPLDHRNIFHPRRGVFSYRVPKLHISERPDLIEKDAQGLWAYLRETGGVGIAHTSGTSMGTDWRLRDDSLIPVTELYQGDRNSYEEEGAPRAALPKVPGDGGGGLPPFQKGLIWNALGVGYKMGFIASSDHFSTHISYANLLVPDGPLTRDTIQNALGARHTYASTDNIVVDFRCPEALQGDEIRASQSPTFQVKVIGTAPILRVELIKNNRVVYTRPNAGANSNQLEFQYRDTAFGDTTMAPTSQIKDWEHPDTGIRPRPKVPESYYYVRVIQSYGADQLEVEGEIAWSSPIYVIQNKP